MREEEYITCAAIWYIDLPSQTFLPKNIEKGVVLCGQRHNHCVDVMFELSKKRTVTNAPDGVGNFKQGFMTNKNRFVDRQEAAIIAFKAKQIEIEKKKLYSEDIY